MYENITVESIKNSILSRIDTDIDVREGSFFNDMISAAAYEIWKNYQTLDSILPIVFIDETSGEYIDKKCAEYGIKRKEGTKATALLHISGTNGTVIPKGKVFLTNEGLEFILDEDLTISDGTATGTATAEEVGEKYNVAAGKIIRQFVNQSGITSVTNDAATGGTEPETDAALVARYYSFLQKPATSGNANQYRQWALEVPGIGDAKVFPLWDGPGTVKIVIINSNLQPVTELMINAVEDYIESVRPIGASVTVASAIAKTIEITATLEISSGYEIDDITSSFTLAVSKYLKSVAFNSSYISYAKIGALLFGIDGVLDYTDLKINGSNSNIALSEDEVPVLSAIDLEV